MNTKIENTIPVLPVSDLEQSINFYSNTLGFALDWRGEQVASVSRNRHPIMLSQLLEIGSSSWVWIGVTNYAIFEEYRSKGVEVFQEPMNHDWAYEMKFKDRDGNVLWFGTETRNDIPLDD